jgi:hypothetical protein
MVLTSFQRGICRLLAGNRLRSGESYVAGGAALNTLLRAPRLSRDIDLFHDTEEALAASWTADRTLLEREGYALSVIRERPTFVEAEVARGNESVVVQWAQDSAYRFFSLIEDREGPRLQPGRHPRARLTFGPLYRRGAPGTGLRGGNPERPDEAGL